MEKLRYYGYIAAGISGLIGLFLLDFCYIVAAFGLFTFGLIAFPASLLGAAGVIHVTSDIPFPALAASGAGILLLGFGMCLGTAAVCPASMQKLRVFLKSAGNRKRQAEDA